MRAFNRCVLSAAGVVFLTAAGVSRATRIVDYSDPRSAVKKINESIKTVEAGGYNYEEKTIPLIDEAVHLLRGPIPGGQGYQFASVVTDGSIEPQAFVRTKVDADHNRGVFQKVAGETTTVFELEIYSPLHRGFFKNNGDTYVESYTLTYNLGGAVKTVTQDFKTWVRRGQTYTIPLPGVVDRARLEMSANVLPSDVNRAYIEMRAKHPRVEDKPESPYYFAIRELLDARDYASSYAKRDKVAEKLNGALSSLQYFPAATGDRRLECDASRIVRDLEYVLYLVRGDENDRRRAEEKLEKIIADLR
ncbi:MAG: hypothetical protein AB1742_02910 [bacterium]